MTEQEFADWKKWTERSKHHWTVDPIKDGKEGRELLVHIGGENGKYLCIQPDGLMLIGDYEDAIPHIGDALFKVSGRKKFASMGEAITRAIEVGGLAFLLDFMGIRAYETRVH